jgi:hypothetical protein
MFRLCLALGGRYGVHPDVLETVLNRRQIYEWMAYAKLFPFGDDRDDYRVAHQTWSLRRAWVDEDLQPDDFMPKFDNAPPKSEAQLIADKILESL